MENFTVPAAFSRNAFSRAEIFKKNCGFGSKRIAAVAAASLIAEENNWSLGSEVGYQVRFDRHCTDQTTFDFS